MAAELPEEVGMAAELLEEVGMVAELPEVALLALYVAVGCAEILKPLLDFLLGVPERSPVLDAAAAAVVLTLPMAYLVGVMLLYLHVAPAAAPAAPPAVLGRFVALVCSFFLFVAFIFFLAAGGR